MTSGYDPWNVATFPLAALVGESDYCPLRRPLEGSAPVELEGTTVAVGNADTRPLERADITPGMRWDRARGEWLYSAAWL